MVLPQLTRSIGAEDRVTRPCRSHARERAGMTRSGRTTCKVPGTISHHFGQAREAGRSAQHSGQRPVAVGFRWAGRGPADGRDLRLSLRRNHEPQATRRKPTSPGEILREEYLAPLGMTQKQLADHLGCDVKVVNRIVNGRSAVTATVARSSAPPSAPAGVLAERPEGDGPLSCPARPARCRSHSSRQLTRARRPGRTRRMTAPSDPLRSSVPSPSAPRARTPGGFDAGRARAPWPR